MFHLDELRGGWLWEKGQSDWFMSGKGGWFQDASALATQSGARVRVSHALFEHSML
jgi:hypothetical protein